MKYFSIVFGCQMNYADAERMITVLKSLGYKSASSLDEADLLIVNMCSVRQSAVDRVYGLVPKIRQRKKEHPSFRSILTGCILRQDQQKLETDFDLVLDRQELPNWPERLGFLKKNHSIKHYLEIKPSYQHPFQAFVPIMTGCDYRCTYCVVPLTRHQESYRPTEDILKEIQILAQKNYQEIWLLGQNVNRYSSIFHSQPIDFNRLLKLIEKIPGNFWLYFTSPYPSDFSDELIATIAESKKLAPYLNLPLQSGDDAVLKKMNRRYSVEEYCTLVKKIKKAFQKHRIGLDRYPSLSTDIIVGFPGETKKAFRHTKRVFKKIGFDAAHIAAYSPRPQTAAALFKDQVPHQEKQRRVKKLTDILRQTTLENNKRYLHQTIPVLIKEKSPKDFLLGRSFSYQTIKIPGNDNQTLVGKKVMVKINKISSWQLEGEILNHQ